MNEKTMRKAASERAKDFLLHSADFRLGDIEAEQSHPMTRNMSDAFRKSIPDGLTLLTGCDALLAPKLRATLDGDAFHEMERAMLDTLQHGGRIILSGCGSSGRLCMRLENAFRLAVSRTPGADASWCGKVISLMTGGDYAVIRAVESFEDFTALGRRQAEELNLGEHDLLIGVTATGETTSILGTAARALDDGASVWMVVCSHPDSFYDRLPRAATVYRRPRSQVLFLPCGPMALTGSTRMQSSTYEQAVLSIALERVWDQLTNRGARPVAEYADAFENLTGQMNSETCIAALAAQVGMEETCYQNHGLITYFADEFLLDVLTDTTERSPTFMTPPFVSAAMTGQEPSWAFVKNPEAGTEESWTRCFRRTPRCIEWDHETFAQLGLQQDIIHKIPPIGLQALCDFRIGREPAPERETASGSIAVWIGQGPAPDSFPEQARRYHHQASFTLRDAGISPMTTGFDTFEHLAMKMLLNDFSTATMVRLGRVESNWMTWLNISNKKLVDRAGRIISLLSDVPYEKALTELFYTEELLKARNDTSRSATQVTLRRLAAEQN